MNQKLESEIYRAFVDIFIHLRTQNPRLVQIVYYNKKLVQLTAGNFQQSSFNVQSIADIFICVERA